MREEKPAETVVRDGRDPLIGSKIGDHVLDGLIGEGSAARVYRARSTTTGELSAIKILSREVGANHDLVERMRREAEALARIEHPNVVRTFDFGSTAEGRPYLVMELIRGRTLSTLIAEEAPFQRRTFAELARQMAAGLAAAHAAGIVHRDLKPSNVLVTSTAGGSLPRVKLVDFGLVRGLGAALGADRALTDHHALLGTPLYMAPEQLMNPRDAQPTSDLYALGVIFYEMLSGRVPFDGPMMSVFEQHFRADPPPIPTRTGFEALAFTLLQKSPSDRPPSAEAVVDAIDVLAEPTGEITRVAARDEEPTGRVAPAKELMGDEETTGSDFPVMKGGMLPFSEGPTEGSFNFHDPTIVDRETEASLLATSAGISREALQGTRILVEEDFAPGSVDTELDVTGDVGEAHTVVADDPRSGGSTEDAVPAFQRPDAPSDLWIPEGRIPKLVTKPLIPSAVSLPGILVQPVLDEQVSTVHVPTPMPLSPASPLDNAASIDLHDTLVPGTTRRPDILDPVPVVLPRPGQRKPPTPVAVRAVREQRKAEPQIRVIHAAPRGMRVVAGLAILCALFLVAFAITMRFRAGSNELLHQIVIPPVGSSTTG